MDFIPERLKLALAASPEIQGFVLSTVASCAALTKDVPIFFPEYTDHSIRHFRDVLRSADSLISDQAHRTITTEDAAGLIIAVCLHDLGMHLTFDGFKSLVERSQRFPPANIVIPRIDSETWPELWQEFLKRAVRWDGAKRAEIFGNALQDVVPPPSDERQLTFADRLTIGEFLRMHHARLAHEIAIAGFPGANGRIEVVPHSSFSELKDLFGLIARSHGIPLRRSVGYLAFFHQREFQSVHPGFLMVVLRIADYLQIDAQRAPGERLSVQSLKSPISQREWNVHAAIRNISVHEDDPESLFIDAQPKNVLTFIRLRNLLADLQSELEVSWAVLGELYGRYPKLRPLTIDLRRVNSSLDDPERFGATVPYIPIQCNFTISRPDILTLLVGPLYGHNPHFAVRELIQNAVDACRERTDIGKHTSSAKVARNLNPKTTVSVALEKGEKGAWFLSVSDNGVGMSPDTVINYFLKVGASYRTSGEWTRLHTDGGKGLKSRIIRSGRFGIGMLAAFILGEEIEVETQHIFSDRYPGLKFTASLRSDAIELIKIRRAPGTSIRIRLNSSSLDTLLQAIKSAIKSDDKSDASADTASDESDWRYRSLPRFPNQIYYLNDPDLDISVDGKQIIRKMLLPNVGEQLPLGWHRLRTSGLDDFHWFYDRREFFEYNHGRIALNGLALGYLQREDKWDFKGGFKLPVPNISIFDRQNKLGVNLTRTGFSDPSPSFQKDLLEDVIRDVLAAMLIVPEDLFRDLNRETRNFSYGPWGWLGDFRLHYMFSQEGYSFVHPAFLKRGVSLTALEIDVPNGADLKRLISLLPREGLCCVIPSFPVRAAREAHFYLFAKHESSREKGLNRKRLRVFVRPEALTSAWSSDRQLAQLSKMQVERKNRHWACLVDQARGPSVFPLKLIGPELDSLNVHLAQEIEIRRPDGRSDSNKSLWRLVRTYLGAGCWIPFSMEMRRKKFKKAYRDLAKNMEMHQALLKDQETQADSSKKRK